MRSRVAWSLFALSVVFAAGALAFWIPTRTIDVSELPRPTDPALIAVFLVYGAVGALIVSRQFGNLVGWIFLAAGVGLEFVLLCLEYSIYALEKSPGTLPGGEWAAWIAELAPPAALGLGTFLLLLFPTGRLLSPRWRVVAWLAAAALIVMSAGIALAPGTLTTVAGIEKPVSVDFPLFTGSDWVWPLLMLSLLLGVVCVILRYRRGDATERQQLRWFLAAGPLFVASFFVIDTVNEIGNVIAALGFASLPVAAGVAILRYHLYDLDVVVRRTLVYGALTALLAGLYFGIVIALQEVFSPLTRGNDLAIAGSTLVAAALFRPARGWIQGIVDRRFYRRRYDAAATLEAFSARLRDEVDLDALGTDLGAVVHETMGPAHVSLWLRPQERNE